MGTKDMIETKTDRRVRLARSPMESLFDMKEVKEKYEILKTQFDVWMDDYAMEAYDANQLLLKHMQLEKDLVKMTKRVAKLEKPWYWAYSPEEGGQ